MINTITSENQDQSLEYTYLEKITRSEYASFLRFLLMTIRKDLPIEILNNDDDSIIKARLINFTVDYKIDGEGEADNLSLNFVNLDSEKQETLKLINTGKNKASKDSESGSSRFYRFYIYAENNEEGYRVTFNRRVTKK